MPLAPKSLAMLTPDQARDRRPAAEMHRRIYQAIRDRNRVLAQTLMSDHLLGAEREQDSEAAESAPVHAVARARAQRSS